MLLGHQRAILGGGVMTAKHYGITQQNLKSTRKAMKVALMCVNQSPEDMNAWHGYYMAQLAQTYRTRKVMYGPVELRS
ncbi:hypothetical protein [Klebsiella phage KP32_isolate 194]|uniref:Uncharacterized protein n=1 Tax=Klebsiella phage KP32_isolate 194 TaxID=2790305 RepID=A0A2U8USJ1_9CAUD|nr:hypothetical protein HOT23_gp02 [Klebsiella phage KP32_isolate 194]AWN07090.1 hypothetical protein [Klebsiella phage KP32_isolate 194]